MTDSIKMRSSVWFEWVSVHVSVRVYVHFLCFFLYIICEKENEIKRQNHEVLQDVIKKEWLLMIIAWHSQWTNECLFDLLIAPEWLICCRGIDRLTNEWMIGSIDGKGLIIILLLFEN